MTRSGYVDDYENPGTLNCWRANVDRTLGGKRGQAFLREMASALDAMPVKELIAYELVSEVGAVCAIGSVAVARKMDVSKLDPDEPDDVSAAFRISGVLTREIVYENDENAPLHERGEDGGWKRLPPETPAQRWQRMRKWVDAQIRTDKAR